MIAYTLETDGLYYSKDNSKISNDLLKECKDTFGQMIEDRSLHLINNDNFTFLKQPLLQEAFAKVVLLEQVLELPFMFFEGREFFLGTVNLRRSKETPARETTTTLYHRDQNLGGLEGTRGNFLKVFVYLTDVTENTGPFTYIVGSNKDFKEGNGKYRLSDTEALDLYGLRNEIRCVAPAGTILSADTTGLHKGTKVRSGYRDMFTINFCTKQEKNSNLFQVRKSFLDQIEDHKKSLFRYYTEI